MTLRIVATIECNDCKRSVEHHVFGRVIPELNAPAGWIEYDAGSYSDHARHRCELCVADSIRRMEADSMVEEHKVPTMAPLNQPGPNRVRVRRKQ